MTRARLVAALVAAVALNAPALLADVKTQEKVTLKFAGTLGSIINRFGGAATKEGLVSSVAIKGDRRMNVSGDTGEIIDLAEQKVYRLDMKSKTYKVATFDELRAAFEKAKADAEKQRQEMKPEDKKQIEDAGKQLEFDADVKETGQRKNLLGYDTHEVILTITAHEKGKKVEESGGFILTEDLWLGPKIAALDEVMQFQIKFIRAVYGDQMMADMQQMASTIALYPAFQPMASKLSAERGKLQGTAIVSSTTFDAVKSAEDMKESSQQQPPPTSGGGIGGMLARRMMNKNQPQQQRATVLTSSHEFLSVSPAASAEDVALPANFKEKK
jgi:hypothetical protein